MANQIEKLAKKLENLGLTEKQARVYTANLFLGSAPVQDIAKQSEVNRATTYVILEELEDMGLVSESTTGKKTTYTAESPEALDQLFDKMQHEIEEKRHDLEGLMPELEDAARGTEGAKAPVVRFYKGIEGVKSINAYLFRKARRGSETYNVSNVSAVEEIFPEGGEQAVKKRLKKDISAKLLYSYKEEIPSNPDKKLETRKLSNPPQADISIFEDSAALIAYNKDPKRLTGVLIESSEIVTTLRQLFENAWDNAE